MEDTCCYQLWARSKPVRAAICISLSVFSVFFYLVDFVTNLMTLHTYYYYSRGICAKYNKETDECDDPVLMNGHSLRTVFFVCLGLIVLAHFSNTLIFWRTLDAKQHRFRLAYFLPVLQFCRLLKVLRQCRCSASSVEDLQADEKESSNLYNVLSASLEAAPQLMLQFHVIMVLGNEDIKFSSDYEYDYEIAEPIPPTLILSIVASLVSCTYNGSVAVLSLTRENRGTMSLQWKACILMVVGLHILAAIAAKAVIVAALAPSIFPVAVYLFVAVVVTWIFLAFVLQKSQLYSANNKKWVHGVHSLALTHVSVLIGPMYVIVKHFPKRTVFLMWATTLHIFVELLGLGAVLITLGPNGPAWQTPCHYNNHHDIDEVRDNIYLSCKVFVEAVCPLLFILFISSLVFSLVDKRADMGCGYQLEHLSQGVEMTNK